MRFILALSFLSVARCIRISPTFDILGPFPIGTREASWGTDPLGRYGGFQNITYSSNAVYVSALGRGAAISWSKANLDGETLRFEFKDVINWQEQQAIYGWAGLQFQAWARGWIEVEELSRVKVEVSGAVEFFIGSQKFLGDVYGYNTAPVLVSIPKGRTRIDIMVAGDIRATGGKLPPSIKTVVRVLAAQEGLTLDERSWKIPDAVPGGEGEGIFAGEFGTISVMNEGFILVDIIAIEGANVVPTLSCRISLRPGQHRPLKFALPKTAVGPQVCIKILYRHRMANGKVHTKEKCTDVKHTLSIYRPHTFTYLHHSGIASYGIIRPPSSNARCVTEGPIPILLVLHGSGVDVRTHTTRSSYDAEPDLCAWVVMPSGVTPWTGDDWHIWGFGDAKSAVASVPMWMFRVEWPGEEVDVNRWVVSGHSNGGQGTWYASTHHNDKILAAAILSGFTSIQNYVPYHFWHIVEPQRFSLSQSALNAYRHELLIDNLAGTPILHQHGDLDDNVPVYHARLMAQLLKESGWTSDYREVPDHGHWWPGIMVDGDLPEFLHEHLTQSGQPSKLTNEFSIIVANPADSTSRGGLRVDQLEFYNQLGRIDVEVREGLWVISTQNIRRWHLNRKTAGNRAGLPEKIRIDDSIFPMNFDMGSEMSFFKDGDSWTVQTEKSWKNFERHSLQLGPVEGILRSQGTFQIVIPLNSSECEREIALEVSRNLFLHFGADAEIIEDWETPPDGNIICISSRTRHKGCEMINSPIKVVKGAYVLNTIKGNINIPVRPSSGFIQIQPGMSGRLAVSIYGTDEEGLWNAFKLFPFRTGAGIPDFVVLGKESWKGLAGAAAIGYLDNEWKINVWNT